MRKHRHLWYLLSFLLLTKLAILLLSNFGTSKLTKEEKTFLHYAESAHRHFEYYSSEGKVSRMPGYIAAIVTVKKLTRSYIILYKIMNILLSLVTAIFVYFALSDNKRFLGATFVSLMPPYFVLYEFILAENLAVPFSAIAIFLFLKFKRTRQVAYFYLFNLANLFLMLTLPETILAVFLVNAYLVFKQPKLKYGFIGLVFLFNFWVAYVSYVLKDYPTVSSQTAFNFYLAVYPEATGTSVAGSKYYDAMYLYESDMHEMKDKDEVIKHKMVTEKAWGYLFKNPWTYISQLPTRIGYFFNMEIDEIESLISQRRVSMNRFVYGLFYFLMFAWYFLFWAYMMKQMYTKSIPKIYYYYWIGALLPYVFVVAEARNKLSFIPVFVIALLARKYK